MRFEKTLQQYKTAPSCMLATASVTTMPALQPRDLRLVPLKDKARSDESSQHHITSLRLLLEASQTTELDPLLVADVNPSNVEVHKQLYVVDGHHRLQAYRLAGRRQVPAIVLPVDIRTAAFVAKLANCSGRSLPMHREQCRDAAWQYISELTQRGKTSLPEGESLRSVAARFGISKNTVSSMVSSLARVDLDDFPPSTLDAGTGWPRWRYVRQSCNPWSTLIPSLDDSPLDRDAERVAKLIVKVVEGSSPEVRARALEMLANDEVHAPNQLESVELLAHFSPPPSDVLRNRGCPNWVS